MKDFRLCPPEFNAEPRKSQRPQRWNGEATGVTRDDHGNITSDPNRLDDEQYIVRLLAQVVTVSLETTRIVKALPEVRFE